MHAGMIVNADGSQHLASRAGRLFAFLDERRAPCDVEGESVSATRWFGGWELTLAVATSGISTRIAEIRFQLPGGELYDGSRRLGGYAIESRAGGSYGDGWWYRLVRRPVTVECGLF